MKKALLILLVLFSSMAFVMAASFGTDNNLTDAVEAGVDVTLDLSNVQDFRIGFSDDGTHKESAVYASGFSLTVDGNVANNGTKQLHIWWDITANQSYTLTLEATPMIINQGTETSDKIDYTVTGSGEGVAVNIDTSNAASATVLDVDTASSSGTVVTETGSQTLTIETEDLDGKTASADFKGTLTLTVTAG